MTAEELYEQLVAVVEQDGVEPLVMLAATEAFYATIIGAFRDEFQLNMIEQSTHNVRRIIEETEG